VTAGEIARQPSVWYNAGRSQIKVPADRPGRSCAMATGYVYDPIYLEHDLRAIPRTASGWR